MCQPLPLADTLSHLGEILVSTLLKISLTSEENKPPLKRRRSDRPLRSKSIVFCAHSNQLRRSRWLPRTTRLKLGKFLQKLPGAPSKQHRCPSYPHSILPRQHRYPSYLQVSRQNNIDVPPTLITSCQNNIDVRGSGTVSRQSNTNTPTSCELTRGRCIDTPMTYNFAPPNS